MPRKTKEINEEKEIKKSTKSTVKRKAAATKTTKTTSRKSVSKKDTTASKPAAKKATAKTTSTVKKTTTKKATVSRRKKSAQPEYYDLPYSYNQTVIKLLAQTPKTIFVYWEISQEDVSSFIQKYGNDFFNNTIPVLSVYNEDKNYYFDVIINDFANSWYINVPDEACKYRVTLKRVFKEQHTPEQQFVEITSSNEIIIPNGHVLLNSGSQRIEYMNIKTKNKYFRVFFNRNSSNKFFNEHIDKFGLNNPSSDFGRM